MSCEKVAKFCNIIQGSRIYKYITRSGQYFPSFNDAHAVPSLMVGDSFMIATLSQQCRLCSSYVWVYLPLCTYMQTFSSVRNIFDCLHVPLEE